MEGGGFEACVDLFIAVGLMSSKKNKKETCSLFLGELFLSLSASLQRLKITEPCDKYVSFRSARRLVIINPFYYIYLR